MPKISFDVSGWQLAESASKDDKTKLDEATRKNIMRSSLQAKRMIQIRMPIDIGAARSSWGARGEAGIWVVDNEGFLIIQGSKLFYIEVLNEGSSTQAPPGFIDVEEEKAVRMFVEDMATDMQRIIGS